MIAAEGETCRWGMGVEWDNRNIDAEAMGEEPRKSREGLHPSFVANKRAHLTTHAIAGLSSAPLPLSHIPSIHLPKTTTVASKAKHKDRASLPYSRLFVCDSYRIEDFFFLILASLSSKRVDFLKARAVKGCTLQMTGITDLQNFVCVCLSQANAPGPLTPPVQHQLFLRVQKHISSQETIGDQRLERDLEPASLPPSKCESMEPSTILCSFIVSSRRLGRLFRSLPFLHFND